MTDCTDCTDRTAATDAEFVARLDEFAQGVANPPEVLRERLAKTLSEVDGPDARYRDGYWLRLADAALDVFPTQQDDAVQRVLAFAERRAADECGPTRMALLDDIAVIRSDVKGDQP